MTLQIGVLGPGAIGGLLAGLFYKQGDNVFCVGRQSAISMIQEKGIEIKSSVFGDFKAHPEACTKLSVSLDILFVTLKSPFLLAALEEINPKLVENTIIIPLLNGVGHREIIRSKLGAHIAVGTIGMIEVIRDEKGTVKHLSKHKPHIDLASDKDVPLTKLQIVVDALNVIGIETTILENEAEVIWAKLVRLNAIASTTAAFQESVGAIRSDPKKRVLLEAIVQEGALVAQHEGININPDDVVKQIDALPEKLMTSLQRDIQTQRPSEIESITGGVLSLARTYNIPAPAHNSVYRTIKSISPF